MDYRVITDLKSALGELQLRFVVVILEGVEDREQAEQVLNGAVPDLLEGWDGLRLYAYLEEAAIQWGGYVARVEAVPGKAWALQFDNDPEAREALWLALRPANG